MSFDLAIVAALSEKLDKRHVKPPSQYGPKGDYLEGWLVISEANRIFGFDGWTYAITEFRCVSERPRAIGREKKDGWGVTYLCRLSVNVLGVTREDTGAGHGYDLDCGLAHESASKEAVTDALKRALRSFGNPFGLALYDKSRENVGDPEGDRAKEADELAKAARAETDAQALIHAISECATQDQLKALWIAAYKDARKPLTERDDVKAAKDAAKARIANNEPPF